MAIRNASQRALYTGRTDKGNSFHSGNRKVIRILRI